MIRPIPNDDYYLNYFVRMIDVVEHRYGDILSEDVIWFIAQTRACTRESLRLLIRLYMRKGPNFLLSKLNYAEVPDCPTAVAELCSLELLEQNPEVFACELIDLLPIADSRRLFGHNAKTRKADLYDQWLDDDTLQSCTDWGADVTIVRPLDYDSLRRVQLLFFGNDHQDITEFILEDLGLFRYETQSLDKATRLFDSAETIDQYLALNDLRAEFYLMHDNRDYSGLVDLTQQALKLQLPATLQPKWHRFLNRLGYRLEQLGELALAQQLFATNDRPPSRERQVRILSKLEQYPQAMRLLEQMHQHPMSSDEVQFYRRFVNKLNRWMGNDRINLSTPPIRETYHSWRPSEGSVEQQACRYFPGAVWQENRLPLAVFGLIYWPVIFADIAGVWQHPFQAAPTDLDEPDFVTRRQNLIDAIARQDAAHWRASIVQHWHSKQGIRNPFVQWHTLDPETILQCFDALSKTQWQGIFDHLLMDLRQYRSGFPDLFQVHDGHYRFIEIKGPGDKLQDNQIAWLEVFAQLGIEAEVCYVRYEADDRV